MAVYRPKFVTQWNDPTTTLDWYNCTMASGAMALDFDTLGHIQVWGGQLRAVSGDNSGGTGLGSPGLTQAWAHYGQTLHVQTGQGWASVILDLKSYKGVVLQGMYGALPKAYHSPLNSLTFTGPHAIYLNPEFNANGDILMGDPLNDKFIWVPQTALRAFASALGSHETGNSAYIFFASTDPHVPAAPIPDPQPYVHTVQVTTDGLNIRTAPSTSASVVGQLNAGTQVKTTLLKLHGGSYTVNGMVRTDWLGFTRNGTTVWIARAYTKLIS